MSDIKLSFCCIAKNEEKSIGRMLDSVKNYVDEIIVVDTGSTDKTKDIAESRGAIIHDFEWVDDFSAARNFSFSKCTGDLIFWMDCDDELVNGKEFKQEVKELFSDARTGALFMVYNYASDDDYGYSVLEHWKMRVMRNGYFFWKGRIHEDPLPKWETAYKKTGKAWIKHHMSSDHQKTSSERNLKILLEEYERNGEKTDPRVLFYLGNSYLGLHEDDKAIDFYEMHHRSSGWREEKYVGLMRIAQCYIRKKEFSVAIDTCLRAIKLLPDWPNAYHKIAQCYLSLKQYTRVEHWTEMGFRMKIPDAQVLINPRDYDLYPLIALEDAFVQQGKFGKAIEIQKKILQFTPGNPDYIERMQMCKSNIEENRLIGYVRQIKDRLEKSDDKERLRHLAKAVPEEIMDMPTMARLRNYENSDRSSAKEICIYCGPSHEPWSPRNVKTGLGGSEEAVVNMSRELTKLGYLVTVYSMLPQEPENPNGMGFELDGVKWKNFWEFFETVDKHWDIVIIWRSSYYLKVDWNCDQLYVWLHDMQEQIWWSPETIEKVDKFFVLSEFHRKNVDFIPDDKIFITSNGIDVSHFQKNLERKPHSVIYSSSPDRGLNTLLYCWPEIRKEVPDATLDIYYGFTPIWDAMYYDNDMMMQFKKDMLNTIEDLKNQGVTYHGRVGHQELADAILQSDVWGYPTCFPEISCITAMKVQAAGAIPVCSSYAALNETVQNGVKLSTPVMEPVMEQLEWRKKFTKAMISVLRNPDENERKRMIEWAKDKFQWSRVAFQWDELFSKIRSRDNACVEG